MGAFRVPVALPSGGRGLKRNLCGNSPFSGVNLYGGSCIAFMPYLPRVCGVCRPHGGGSLCTFRRGGFFVSAARPLILLPPLPSGNSQRVRVPVVRHGRKGRGCPRVRGVNRVPPAAFIAPSGNRTTAAKTADFRLPGIPKIHCISVPVCYPALAFLTVKSTVFVYTYRQIPFGKMPFCPAECLPRRRQAGGKDMDTDARSTAADDGKPVRE